MTKRKNPNRRSSLGGHWAGPGTETAEEYEDFDSGVAEYRPIRQGLEHPQQLPAYVEKMPGVRLPTKREDWEKMSGPVKYLRLEDLENDPSRKSN